MACDLLVTTRAVEIGVWEWICICIKQKEVSIAKSLSGRCWLKIIALNFLYAGFTSSRLIFAHFPKMNHVWG